ncbi:MAG: rhodanese-like domain-containing protein [Flavobacteriales bacterium]|nr:rhodanese-like domain-containing protein [Flavobacteriales bacterium]
MLRTLFGMGPKVDYKELVSNGATILDVRSKAEFASGHVKGAINIPLDQLAGQMKKLPKGKPVVACCLSGARSGRAVDMLKAEGIDAYNGGGWASLNSALN